MTSRDFCFWLQGYLEIEAAGGAGLQGLSRAQVETVQKHLSLVFVHDIDPTFGNSNDKLDGIHNPSVIAPPILVPASRPDHIARC